MSSSNPPTWYSLAFDSWFLSMEAAQVMWLRGLRVMSGGKVAENEVQRMVTEKLVTNASLWPALAEGGFVQSPEQIGARTLRHYGKPVRANRRRLSR